MGAVGFGGPAAFADRIQRDLVERRGWMMPQEYELGLTVAAACPGALAARVLTRLPDAAVVALGAAARVALAM